MRHMSNALLFHVIILRALVAIMFFVVCTIQNTLSMSPGSDFYKKLALECSSQQIAVDVFAFCGMFTDLPTVCESEHTVHSACMEYRYHRSILFSNT